MSTNIEWTKGNKTITGDPMQGKTWNVTVGCTEEDRGCRECYAAKMAWRIMHIPGPAGVDYAGTAKKLPNGKIVWTGKVNILEHRLLEPVLTKQPTTFFPDSMSDLFHPDIPFAFLDKVFAVMMLCPQHIFQVLTKRHVRMMEYMMRCRDFDYIDEAAAILVMENPHLFHKLEKLTGEAKKLCGPFGITNELLPHLTEAKWCWDETYYDDGAGGAEKDIDLLYEGDWPAKHIWLGVSLANQRAADKRWWALHELHKLGWITWISNEPSVGPINWAYPNSYSFVDWIVTGGESGTKADPLHPDWAADTRDFCRQHSIPFFFKQFGTFVPAIEHPLTTDDNFYIVLNNGDYGPYHSDNLTYKYSNDWQNMKPVVMKKTMTKNGNYPLFGQRHNEYPQRQSKTTLP